MEVADLLIRGFFLTVMMIKAFVNYSNNDLASFIFFLLSRLWIALLWTIFAFELSRGTAIPDKNSYSTINGENGERRATQLSSMLKFDIMASKFRMTVFSVVAVCGVLDMSILRLLPWLPTEFSKYVNGYPNLFALRCCVYGSNVSLILQCIASVVLLEQGGQSTTNFALSVVLVFLSIFLMLKTFMETVFGIQKGRSDKMVTVLELDERNLQLVDRDSKVVLKTDNPQRSDAVISLQNVVVKC
jgi:hypothetical protein